MSDRDRLAADLRSIHGGPAPWPGAMTSEQFADRLIALGWTRLGKCGCSCNCHRDEERPEWPGDCAGCCEPGMNCNCGRALPLDEERLARALYAQESHVCDDKFRNCAVAIAKAYREDADA